MENRRDNNTVDGIILGFTIIGITLLSDKVYPATQIEAILQNRIEDFGKNLKSGKLSDSKKIREELISAIDSAIEETATGYASTSTSTLALAASIVLALTLFGVSDTTADNHLLVFVFSSILDVSIITLLWAIYLTYRFLDSFIRKTLLTQLQETVRKAVASLKKSET